MIIANFADRVCTNYDGICECQWVQCLKWHSNLPIGYVLSDMKVAIVSANAYDINWHDNFQLGMY